MAHPRLSGEEISHLAKKIYANNLRAKIENEENIGKMVIIDVETGDYEIDQFGLGASERLYAKHPDAALFGICIGYKTAAAIGGVMERTVP